MMDGKWQNCCMEGFSTLAATGLPIAIIPLVFLLALKCIYSRLKTITARRFWAQWREMETVAS